MFILTFLLFLLRSLLSPAESTFLGFGSLGYSKFTRILFSLIGLWIQKIVFSPFTTLYVLDTKSFSFYN